MFVKSQYSTTTFVAINVVLKFVSIVIRPKSKEINSLKNKEILMKKFGYFVQTKNTLGSVKNFSLPR